MSWAGCNYWKDYDLDTKELLGTATSMHEYTDTCDQFNFCLIKKETEQWDYEKISHHELWNKTIKLKNQQLKSKAT